MPAADSPSHADRLPTQRSRGVVMSTHIDTTTTDTTTTDATTGTVKDYVDAGGLRTYYEAEGTGDPLVMLHGGFASVNTFAGFTPLFTDHHRVYSPERRGHGRMPDLDGPITYEIMADDTVAFLDALGIGPAHL